MVGDYRRKRTSSKKNCKITGKITHATSSENVKNRHLKSKTPRRLQNKKMTEKDASAVASKNVTRKISSIKFKTVVARSSEFNYSSDDSRSGDSNDGSMLGDPESESDSANYYETNPEMTEKKKVKSQEKYLDQIKTQLGLTERDFVDFARNKKKENDEIKTVITAAGKPRKDPEIIVFQDPAKRKGKV